MAGVANRDGTALVWSGRRARLALLPLLTLVVGACSSDPTQDASAGAEAAAAAAPGATSTASSPATLPAGTSPAGTAPAQSTATTGPSDSSVAAETAELSGAALEEHLAQRYQAYWAAFDAARAAPSANPAADFPALSDLAAGTQLEVSYTSVADLAGLGEVIVEPDTPASDGSGAAPRVRVDRVDGTVAELSGCVVNDNVHKVVATGAVIRDAVSTVLSTSTMALTDGRWKLIRSQAVEITDGVAGCWLEPADAFPY